MKQERIIIVTICDICNNEVDKYTHLQNNLWEKDFQDIDICNVCMTNFTKRFIEVLELSILRNIYE